LSGIENFCRIADLMDFFQNLTAALAKIEHLPQSGSVFN
jgi:hypothetical protein